MSESLRLSNAVGNLTGISMIAAGYVMAFTNAQLDTTSLGSLVGSTVLFGVAAAGGLFGVAKIALSCGVNNSLTYWLDRFSTILVVLLLVNCVWRLKDYTGVGEAALMSYVAAVSGSALMILGAADTVNTWFVGKKNQFTAAAEELAKRANAIVDAASGDKK